MTARFLFTFAVQMQAIILGWRMYTLTNNPLYLGMIGLVEAIPALGLALYAGYIVDRSRPLVVYRRVVRVSFLSGVILLISQLPTMDLTTNAQVWLLFLSSFLTGTARSFSQPAMFATVPRLVKRTDLSRASAWMSSAMQVARISGPALGGLLYGIWGTAATAGFVCALLICAMGSLTLIETRLEALPPSTKKESKRTELFSGAKFVFTHPILFPALSLDMVSVLFGGVTSLLPIYAAEILMIGPLGLGILRAAPAIGAAAVSFWLTSREMGATAGRSLFGAVTGFGVCILIFAVSRDFWISLTALTLSGAFDSVSMVIRTSAVQLVSPDSMRGKISAVNSIFIGSSNELGEFESGVAASFMGTVPAAVMGGIVCLMTVAAVGILSPTLRRLDLQKLRNEHHS